MRPEIHSLEISLAWCEQRKIVAWIGSYPQIPRVSGQICVWFCVVCTGVFFFYAVSRLVWGLLSSRILVFSCAFLQSLCKGWGDLFKVVRNCLTFDDYQFQMLGDSLNSRTDCFSFCAILGTLCMCTPSCAFQSCTTFQYIQLCY